MNIFERLIHLNKNKMYPSTLHNRMVRFHAFTIMLIRNVKKCLKLIYKFFVDLVYFKTKLEPHQMHNPLN